MSFSPICCAFCASPVVDNHLYCSHACANGAEQEQQLADLKAQFITEKNYGDPDLWY